MVFESHKSLQIFVMEESQVSNYRRYFDCHARFVCIIHGLQINGKDYMSQLFFRKGIEIMGRKKWDLWI